MTGSMVGPALLGTEYFFCNHSGVYIFLDANRNRYFAFNNAQSSLLDEIVSSAGREFLSPRATVFFQHLLDQEILVENAARGKPLVPMSEPHLTRSAYGGRAGGNVRVQARDVMRFCRALFECRHFNMSRGLEPHSILTGVRRWKRKEALKSVDLQSVVRRVEIFDSIVPYFVTTHNKCLFRSLLLVRFLLLAKIDCALKIGVRTSPFSAHAWVESSEVILNEHHDTTHSFSKIMSV